MPYSSWRRCGSDRGYAAPGSISGGSVQVELRHIRADKLDLRSQLLSDDGEKTLEGFAGAFLANPEQAGEPLVDLVDQRQVLVAFGVLDFIHTNGAERISALQFVVTRQRPE